MAEKKIVRAQIGCKINKKLWHQLKVLAMKKNKSAGELLEEAIHNILIKYKEMQ